MIQFGGAIRRGPLNYNQWHFSVIISTEYNTGEGAPDLRREPGFLDDIKMLENLP